VDVGLQDVRDPQPFTLGEFDERVHVARRIDHRHFLGLLVADHVGGDCEARDEPLVEEHGSS
jgi:hypothetical protein